MTRWERSGTKFSTIRYDLYNTKRSTSTKKLRHSFAHLPVGYPNTATRSSFTPTAAVVVAVVEAVVAMSGNLCVGTVVIRAVSWLSS